MDIFKLSLIIILSIGMPSAYAKVYKWVDEEGNVKFGDKPHPSQQKKFKVNKKFTPIVKQKITKPILLKKKSDNNIPFSEDIILSFRGLLDGNRFLDLNETLHAHQTAVEKDIHAEEDLFTAYTSFEIKDKSYESAFNAWVDATPDEYQPYLARARFYFRLGWEARGEKWASETKNKQLKEMNEYFAKAIKDIAKALKIYKYSMIPYSLLIGIANTNVEDSDSELILKRAIEFNPATYYVRRQYIISLTPRWGGSYEKMKLFVIESMRYLDKNPKLKLLEGYIYLDLGKMQKTINKYSVAEKYYDNALEFGLNHNILKERGVNSYKRENYNEALKYLDLAIQLYTEDAEYYYWRSRVYKKLEKYKESSSDIERAFKLDPTDEYIQSHRKWLVWKFSRIGYSLNKNEKPVDAIEQYNAALVLDPNNASLYYRRSRALIKKNDYDQAYIDLDRAIQLEPNDINYYLLMDYILVRKKDWVQIINYWGKFIEINPNSSRAYLERSGAYYHKGDITASLDDAKTAADMGNSDAKNIYERYKHLSK